jgi:hypothetical protein
MAHKWDDFGQLYGEAQSPDGLLERTGFEPTSPLITPSSVDVTCGLILLRAPGDKSEVRASKLLNAEVPRRRFF